ncbi:T9SS type A sorting domain-containing protein [Aestuariivivens sediminis]|uniref:T9SS type A sorting domain-containing protein n=1 Tax=Aestuariivivens sediminis TaxID=2913557 RepID=UPI001F59D76B|nr:T9SS type A sorting domain-containing protein [Aestuariivivens sediminis]
MKKSSVKSLLEKVKFRTGLVHLGWIIMLFSSYSYAQTIARQSVSSYGSTSSVGGHSYAQTVGQAYNTQHIENLNATQGFLQPVSYKIVPVEQDAFEALDLKVFPNPSQYSITIKSNLVLKEAFIMITNVQGHIIYEQHIQSIKEHRINCSTWATGIYLLQVQNENNKRSVSKLIISK